MSIALAWAIRRARSPEVSRTVPQTRPSWAVKLGVFEVANLANQVGRQVSAGHFAGLDCGEQSLGTRLLRLASVLRTSRRSAGSQRGIGLDQDFGRGGVVVGRQAAYGRAAELAGDAPGSCRTRASGGSFTLSRAARACRRSAELGR